MCFSMIHIKFINKLPNLVIDYKTNTTEVSLKLKSIPEQIIDNSKDVSNTNDKEPGGDVSKDTDIIKDPSNNSV